jgi:hypothetical protein
VLKWVGAVLTVLLLVAWVSAIRLSVDVTQAYSIRLTGQGEVQVLLWGTLRVEPEPDDYPHQPDCCTLPLWLPFPDATADLVEPQSIRITGYGFATVVDLLAWGDFDHDGIEDVLLFLSRYATGGTFRFYHHVALTRLDEEAKLTMVDITG